MSDSEQNNAENVPVFKPHELPRGNKLSKKALKAQKVIRKYTLLAGSAGLIPGSYVTQVAVMGLLIKLLNELCRIYDLSFSDHQIKIIVISILGGGHTEWISEYLLKFLKGNAPAVDYTVPLLLRPAISGFVVHYIGKLFLGHLETGAWVRVKEKGLRQFG